MQVDPHFVKVFKNKLVGNKSPLIKALALLCSLCVLCGATMSRPDGLHSSLPLEPETLNTSNNQQREQEEEARPRGVLVLLLGKDLANSPLLSSFLSIALAGEPKLKYVANRVMCHLSSPPSPEHFPCLCLSFNSSPEHCPCRLPRHSRPLSPLPLPARPCKELRN